MRRRPQPVTLDPTRCLGITSHIGACRLPRITNGKDFPRVTVRFAPINDLATVLCVHLHVDRTMDRAAVLDTRSPEPLENSVERLIVDAKTEMLDRQLAR